MRAVECSVSHAPLYRQVLVLEPTKEYMPSYVVMNLDAETSSMHISNICLDRLKDKCRRVHEWVLEANNIKSIRQVALRFCRDYSIAYIRVPLILLL